MYDIAFKYNSKRTYKSLPFVNTNWILFYKRYKKRGNF